MTSSDRPCPWVGLITLAAAIFVLVTSEFLPTGLLPIMASDLGVTEPQIGLLITIFAGTVVLTAAPLAALTRHYSRKSLLLVVLGVFALANRTYAGPSAPAWDEVFDQTAWYYVSSVQESVAFYTPRITERRVMVVRFDGDTVTGVEKYGLERGRLVAYDEHELRATLRDQCALGNDQGIDVVQRLPLIAILLLQQIVQGEEFRPPHVPVIAVRLQIDRIGVGQHARQLLGDIAGEQGLGLGLTLSASLAAATGGHLGVEHPASGGTTFVLSLPLVSPTSAEPI